MPFIFHSLRMQQTIVPTSKEELALAFTVFALPLLVGWIAMTVLKSSKQTEKVHDAIFDPTDGLKQTVRNTNLRYHELNNTVQAMATQVHVMARDMEHLSSSIEDVKSNLADHRRIREEDQ